MVISVPHPKYGYFMPSETMSRDGAKGDIKDVLRDKLNELRNAYGGPIYVISGYRSPEHNRAVGGARNSLHVEGLAADLRLPVNGAARLRLLELSFRIGGFSGRGFYPKFIHVDMRHLIGRKPAYWVSG
jgi:zinc D-Ala-D-Ala carboxypeptidase